MTLDSTRGKTLQAALALLYSVQPEIESILGDEPLCVELESMHVMRLGQSGEAHVLWMGPDLTNPSPATKRLTAVCGECVFLLITPVKYATAQVIPQTSSITFRNHAFVVENRPLKVR
jgi:hypothetical protein